MYNTGRIKLQYNHLVVPTGCYNIYPPNIGIQQNGSAGTYLTYACGAAGIFPIDTLAIWWFQPNGIPTPVTNLQAQVVGSDVTLTWLDATQDTNGNPITVDSVQIWLGPVGSGQRLGAVGPGVQTFTATGLSDGFHTFAARAFHDSYGGGADTIRVLVGEFPWQPCDFDWVEINTIGTNTGLTQDDQNLGPFDLGFEVTYYDQTFNSVYVCSNGWVSFTSTSTRYFNSCLPDPQDPNNSLDLLFDDLYLPSGGQIYYYADAGSRFIVEWDHVPHISGMGTYTMEVIIGSDGSVSYQYNDMGASDATVGVEDATGSDASLQLWCQTFGDFQPVSQSAACFWSGPRVFGPVSGHVGLDGGNGNITQVVVHANGAGSPTVNPAANGDYAFDSVQVGNRVIQASLAGYHVDSVPVTIPDSLGITGVDFTLRRLDPPAPTGLTGSVNSATGVVTLNWDDSPDPLVDVYRLYRKLADSTNWTLRRTSVSSNTTDTLTVSGIYQYRVTAVDNDVSPPPVESLPSNTVTVLYGNLPPTFLSANGNFDDRIRLNWLAPGYNPAYELMYDDSSAESWFSVFGPGQPNGTQDYCAVRFTPPSPDSVGYPLPIQTVNIYLETDTPNLANVWLTPDNGGFPDLNNPYLTWQNIGAQGSPGWLTAHVDGQFSLPDASDFWVVWQFPPGVPGPQVGQDGNSPDSRSYWTYQFVWPNWISWTSEDFMARVWVGGQPGWGLVMSSGTPFGYSIDRIPSQHAVTIPDAKTVSAKQSKTVKASGPTLSSLSTITKNPNAATFPIALGDRLEQPYSHAPALIYQERPHRSTLDDVVYYKIYRDNTFLANDTIPPYDDVVGSANENVPHNYYVRAHYDNNQDSDSTNHVTARANMAPAAPTNLTGTPVGTTQMHLTWTDPNLNSDGSSCVDLATIHIYRDGVQVGIANAGAQSYFDTPPAPDQFYTWTVAGADEVPNLGPQSSGFIGAVVSPWQTCDYDWVEINAIGTNTGLTQDDQNLGPFQLGFDMLYFGQTFNGVYVCSNGWVSFTSTSVRYFNSCLPDPQDPNNSLDLLFDDLYLPSGGHVYYYADAANNRFIVEWDHVPHITGMGIYTMEVIIGSDGSVAYQYNDMGASDATVGVEDATGSDASIQLWCQTNGPFQPVSQTAVCFWSGPRGRVEGLVRQQTGNLPLAGARVETMELPSFTFTDSTGFYTLRLDSGTYTLRFSKDGFCDTTYANVVIGDSTITRNCTLRQPAAQFSITSLSLATWPGHVVTQPFTISNPGGQCPLDYTITDTSAWLSALPANGSIPSGQTVTITVTANPQGLPNGSNHQSALIISHEAPGSPNTIPVSLDISVHARVPGEIPTEYALYQNYPNPFNATTTFRFDLPQESDVKLVLFNLMGQAVAMVAEGRYPAGQHSLSYDATNLPSGMYLVKLEAGSYSSLKKILLLK